MSNLSKEEIADKIKALFVKSLREYYEPKKNFIFTKEDLECKLYETRAYENALTAFGIDAGDVVLEVIENLDLPNK